MTSALINVVEIAATSRRRSRVQAAVHELLLAMRRWKALACRLGKDAVAQADVKTARTFHSGARSIVNLKPPKSVLGLEPLSPLWRRRICPRRRKRFGAAAFKDVEMLLYHDRTHVLQLFVRLRTCIAG